MEEGQFHIERFLEEWSITAVDNFYFMETVKSSFRDSVSNETCWALTGSGGLSSLLQLADRSLRLAGFPLQCFTAASLLRGLTMPCP